MLLTVLPHFLVLGQAGYSPYSSKGIGEIQGLGLTQNNGMGGVGISNGNGMFYNNANPALLYKNNLSVFSIGMAGEYKNVSTSDLSQKNYTGGFDHLMLGLPLMIDRWTIGFGLMPYSTVNYKYNTQGKVVGDPNADVIKNFEGSGGFNKVFLSNGLRLYKNLSLGVTVGYLFGSIKEEISTQVRTQKQVNDTTTASFLSNTVLTTNRLAAGDIYLLGGLAYRLPLSNNRGVNVGVTYEVGGDKDAKLFQNIRNRNYRDNVNFANDTLHETRGTMKLPSTLGIGLSYEKSYHWTVGADLMLRNWSEYRSFSENGQGSNEGFHNSYTVAVGAEYIPDVASIDSYLKRAVYRIGFSHERLPYKINDKSIDDFGINFGVSLPVRNYSSFNLAFKLGRRGTTEHNLIKENYFRVNLGVTFNDRWFVRRRFD